MTNNPFDVVIVKKKTKRTRRAKRARRVRRKAPPTGKTINTIAVPVNPTRFQRLGGPGLPLRTIQNKICSLIDPFCHHAKGAKILDGNSAGSVPLQSRATFSVPIDASGNGLVYIGNGSFPYNKLSVGSSTATDYTTATVFTSVVDANVTAATDQYRIVSAGVSVRNNLSANNSQGQLTISRVTQFPALNSAVPVGVIEGIETIATALYPGAEIQCIGRNRGIGALDFWSKTADTGAMSVAPNHDVFKIEVNGAIPATKAIVVDVVMNLEIALNLTSGTGGVSVMQQIINPKSDDDPLVQKMVARAFNAVGSFVQGTIDASSEHLARVASATAREFFRNPGYSSSLVM